MTVQDLICQLQTLPKDTICMKSNYNDTLCLIKGITCVPVEGGFGGLYQIAYYGNNTNTISAVRIE